MADDQYQYDQDGFREDLKDKKDVLHQPDADRSKWQLHTLDYDETMAFLKGDKEVKPDYHLDDQILDKIRNSVDKINDEDADSVIEDKYQQILLARYNVDQDTNVTIGFDKQKSED